MPCESHPALIDSEPWLQDVIQRAVNGGPRRVAIDVGANKGEWSRMLSKHFDKVIAVEPDARCDLSTLPENVVVIQGTLIGDTDGVQRDFHLRPSSEQNSMLVNHPFPNSGDDASIQSTVSLPMTTLDGMLASMGIDEVDFIKVDVEGSEQDVLSGATEPLWLRSRWIVECHNTKQAVAKELGRIGFQLLTLLSNPYHHDPDSGHGWIYARHVEPLDIRAGKQVPCESHPPLTDGELDLMERRARQFQGSWTGTSGSLGADVMRLLGERQRLIVSLAMIREQHSIERYQQTRGRD